jgi:hypothetical protein
LPWKLTTLSRRRLFDHELVNDKLENLEVGEIDGRRIYRVPSTGRCYPSVTTVIGESLDRGSLDAWRARVGPEKAENVSRWARKRGNSFHSICEAYLLNREEMPAGITFMDEASFQDVRPILDEGVGTVYGIEVPLYSHRLGTAGRADCVATFRGVPSVIDFKTSKRPKEEKHILGYFLQATAYAEMFTDLVGIEIERIAIVVTVDNDAPQLFLRGVDEYRVRMREVFLDRTRLTS